MVSDSIIKEVRQIREAYARQFNYDLKAIHRDLKEQEKRGVRKIVSLPPKPAEPTRHPASRQAEKISRPEGSPADIDFPPER